MLTIITAGLDFLKLHLTTLGAAAGGGVLGMITHAFGPQIYKAIGNKLAAIVSQATGVLFKKMLNPDVADALDRADIAEMARPAIRMASRHMGSAAGQVKMNWVLDFICSKTGLDRVQVGIIAQQVYEAEKAAAAAAIAPAVVVKP